MRLIGRIERIIFEDEGFFVALLSEGEKISGSYFDSSVQSIIDAAVTLEGEYVDHPSYGRTFVFHTLRVNQQPLFFFLNRVVKGFPKKVTAELIETFGEAGLVAILDNDIEKLTAFSGIKQKRLERIQSRWKQFRSLRALGEFLAPFDVSPAMITTIAGAMKESTDAVERIKGNPYILTGIEGIGFKRVDAMALKMGIDASDERRIASAMDYAVTRRCEREGNSCIDKAELFAELDSLLEGADLSERYGAVLLERIAEGTIRPLDERLLSPTRLFEAEQFIFETLHRRSKATSQSVIADLEAFFDTATFEPGEQQRRAVELLNSGVKVMCLVGYAGTGKSTTSKLLLELLCRGQGKEQIITCALSGIAAQRIGEVTGFESATIQSLLVRFEERDVFPYRVILIDEASMVNAPLFARLLAKCHRDATIIIVGDNAQLPPIGPGDVLSDIIGFTLLPTVVLTQIYRQSEDQAIALIADAIRRGNVPDFSGEYTDFRFDVIAQQAYRDRETHAQAILSAIAQAAMEAIPKGREYLQAKKIHTYLTHFQVITPMKSGLLGTENLNRVLQRYFNPGPKQQVKRGEKLFALMDKVVHTRNENLPSWTQAAYKSGASSEPRRIFNGMCGLLFRIDEAAEQVYVIYPVEALVVRYEYAQLTSHLMLSYALTVHKVQGMEYDTVVMPASFNHYIMLQNKLLYTAVTRAKRQCLIIGDPEAFAGGIQRKELTRRQTVMQYLARQSGEY